MRVARPVSDIARTEYMYCLGLGLQVLARFSDHDGFDGLILGPGGSDYHFEFTRSRHHPVHPAPTAEDLIVFYIPAEAQWVAKCADMLKAGFRRVTSFNPYWEERGRTYEDRDGYRVVLQHSAWTDTE